MPPVPDKARTGRFFGRRVMEVQNWTLASNVRWRLTDEQLAVLAGRVPQLAHPLHYEGRPYRAATGCPSSSDPFAKLDPAVRHPRIRTWRGRIRLARRARE